MRAPCGPGTCTAGAGVEALRAGAACVPRHGPMRGPGVPALPTPADAACPCLAHRALVAQKHAGKGAEELKTIEEKFREKQEAYEHLTKLHNARKEKA